MEIARLELPAGLRERLRDIILETAAAAGRPDGAVRSANDAISARLPSEYTAGRIEEGSLRDEIGRTESGPDAKAKAKLAGILDVDLYRLHLDRTLTTLVRAGKW